MAILSIHMVIHSTRRHTTVHNRRKHLKAWHLSLDRERIGAWNLWLCIWSFLKQMEWMNLNLPLKILWSRALVVTIEFYYMLVLDAKKISGSAKSYFFSIFKGALASPSVACKGVHTVPHPPLHDDNPLIQNANRFMLQSFGM